MRKLSFVLLALVGTMILGLPLQSYADPQLNILLNIATQARDNIGVTISQTSNVSNEINQLYKQGSDETDQLATAVNQQDVTAAKQHFLAAMKFFKETNDKINSLNATASNDQQKVEIAQLRGEITRLDNMENLLKNIATTNNIQVDFTKFDGLIQTAQQDLDSVNVNDAIVLIKNANDFLVETHNSLTAIAKERASERAKDFTQRQIERFSKMSGFNTTVTNTTSSTIPSPPPTIPPPTTSPENTIVTNTTSSTIPSPPPTIPPPPISPPTTSPENTTSSNIIPQSATQNNVNPVVGQNPEEMLAELKKLVSEGKVNEALKIIKMIEAYQNGKLKMPEKMEQLQLSTTASNVTENSNSSAATTPSPPPTIPPTSPKNTTGTNTPSSTIPPPPPTHGGNEKFNLEKNKHGIRPHQGNDHQNSNRQD